MKYRGSTSGAEKSDMAVARIQRRAVESDGARWDVLVGEEMWSWSATGFSGGVGAFFALVTALSLSLLVTAMLGDLGLIAFCVSCGFMCA